ncbi:MAG: hypothetical protein PHY80_03850 [Rickettsiales bacterium]|nr:hypothetical protein [Rickettsiales bacterium]
MKTIQNSIIIGLLAIIALGISYFVFHGIKFQMAKRDYERQRQYEIEHRDELKEKSDKAFEEAWKKRKNQYPNSKYNQMLGN